jgi:NAD(P)-dependent dehydrogenase (short-subunit alcohol dehydrogenase family)
MAETGSVIILGAGPGIGAACARRFAKAGYAVALASRHPAKLKPIVAAIAAAGGKATAHACDAAEESDVSGVVGLVEQDEGPLAAAIYNAGAFLRRPLLELEPADMEAMWRISALGGFLLAREAARHMLPRGRGTLIFTGATASLRGGAGFAAFAGGKFALRALAQSAARELGPQGIHVAHVVIDGQVGRDPKGAMIDPDAVAEAYFALHLQPKSAWTHELDLRPSVEKF